MQTTKPISVILADDDPDDHYLVKLAFSELEIPNHLHSVYNGFELLQLLDGIAARPVSDAPDFILLDLNMPRLDGFGVLERLRLNTVASRIPVFILSTSRADDDRQRSRDLGAKGFYTKPIQYQQLKEIIREIHWRVEGN